MDPNPDQIKRKLRHEGYSISQIYGATLLKQLRSIIEASRSNGQPSEPSKEPSAPAS
jgi:hypothetical protein